MSPDGAGLARWHGTFIGGRRGTIALRSTVGGRGAGGLLGRGGLTPIIEAGRSEGWRNHSLTGERKRRRPAGTDRRRCPSRAGDGSTPSPPVAGRATEVERSGAPARLEEAALRLKDSGTRQHVLQVPQHHMGVAAEAMRNAGVPGTVKNMKGTKRRSV